MISGVDVDAPPRQAVEPRPSVEAASDADCRIAILGWYGNGNAGDEAVLSCLLADLQSIRPDATPCVFSANPEETRKTHGVAAVRKALPSNWREAARTIRSSRLFIMGGGTLICDEDAAYSGIASFCAYMLIAMSASVPIVFYAQGIGPVRRPFNRWLVQKLVNRVRLITVRDQASVDTLRELAITRPPVFLTADPAACLAPAPRERAQAILRAENVPETRGPRIALCLKSRLGVEREMARLADALIAELDALVVLVPMQSSGLYNDLAASELVRTRVSRPDRVSLIAGSYTPHEIKGILGEMDMVLGIRLHALVFASAMGVPVLAISYSEKVAGFVTSIGQERWSIDLSELDAGIVVERARALWDARETVRQELATAMVGYQERSRATVEHLSRILNT